MNSFDAIIALSALLAGFAILLGVVNEQKINVEGVINSTNAKTNALECASIIDSMFSNSAEEYTAELNCGANASEINYASEGKIKTAKILTTVSKTTLLEVKILEHYK
ncbi:MAG: hypothetical protein WCW44_03205 [archaeon]|jgi:hypothetical protein